MPRAATTSAAHAHVGTTWRSADCDVILSALADALMRSTSPPARKAKAKTTSYPTKKRIAEIEAIVSARNTKESVVAKYKAHFGVPPGSADTKKHMIGILVASMGEAALAK